MSLSVLTPIAPPPLAALPSVSAIIAAGRARQPLLFGAGIIFLLAMLPTTAALLLDDRTVNDIDVWWKPLKFQLSIALYLVTLAWLYGALAPAARQSRFLNGFAVVSVALLAYEIVYMMIQSARGVGSHFNTATPLEGLLFTLMGAAALVFTAFPAALGIAIARQPEPGIAPAFRVAVVSGLVLTAVLGIASGAALGINGGHWVGAPASDAGGLPIFGWTRQGGDLRVAHFFALHALQVLPVVGWLVARRRPEATGVMWGVAAAYAAFTAYVLAEALLGRPFLPFIG